MKLAETVNGSVIDNDPHHQRYQTRTMPRIDSVSKRGQGRPSVPIILDAVANERDEGGENRVSSDHLTKNSVCTISLGRTALHPASVWPSLR